MTAPDRLAHYQILGHLGAGGMGEVYRARDTRLDREVALKILPADTAGDPEKLARFRQEARALAALDHPGIVTVYSVEEDGDTHFLTMGLVEGRTLDRVIPEGGLPIDTFYSVALLLADAVAAAHEKNIIHRDLKPSNIMITPDGRLKVLDFGLAKLVEQAVPDAQGENSPETSVSAPDDLTLPVLTQAGRIVGTVPYMSPEQLQDRPVDHRTDIFSLGILLYEMAAGRRPFAADSSAGLMSAILKDVPAPVTDTRPEIPPGLNRLITRCLEKEPDHRIQTARDIHNELRALKGGAADAAPTTSRGSHGIAVLPFADMSPAKDQDYFCEGMAEEIMNALVPIAGIRVASRTSSFRARSENRDLPDIGRALHVNHILEGSVRVAGTRMRVTAQLVDTKTGYHVWSERYDREATDVFAVQDEIAAGVVEAVKTRLFADEGAPAKGKSGAPGRGEPGAPAPGVRARSQVKNLDAYRHYLKGRHLRFRNLHAASLASYRKALELDPTHGPSWVGLAETAVLGGTYAIRQTRPALVEARQALATAEKLQGDTADAHCVRGMIAFCERDWAASEGAFRSALSADPDHVQSACWLGMMLAVNRRGDECAAAFERARAIDPLAAFPYGMSGLSLLMVGHADEAERHLQVGLDLEPDHTLVLWSYASVLVHRGRYDEAVDTLDSAAAAAANRAAHFVGMLAWAHGRAGRKDMARSLLEELTERPSPDESGEIPPSVVAAGWAQGALGDLDAGWSILEAARDEQQTLVCLLGHPGFDPFRSHPRWPGFAESLGLPLK